MARGFSPGLAGVQLEAPDLFLVDQSDHLLVSAEALLGIPPGSTEPSCYSWDGAQSRVLARWKPFGYRVVLGSQYLEFHHALEQNSGTECWGHTPCSLPPGPRLTKM